MLPEKVLNEIAEQVERYFKDGSPKLVKAAHRLADAGWTWDEIRPLMSLVYRAGQASADGDR